MGVSYHAFAAATGNAFVRGVAIFDGLVSFNVDAYHKCGLRD